MNNSTDLAERVRFGTFELNLRTGELVSIGTAAVEAGAATVQLRQQPFQILRILVERQGKNCYPSGNTADSLAERYRRGIR